MKRLIKRSLLLCIISLIPCALMADEMTGELKYNGNKPIVGYFIKNINNEKIAITNAAGLFKIDAKIGDRLEIIYQSDVVATHTVALTDYITITLPRTPFLDKVENVASPTIYRETSASAIDMVTSDDIENTSFTNSTHSFIGKFASLTTSQSSGMPNADNLTFIVRGKNSMNSNTPLVLIDGFESSMDLLSNLEIESISILKDAVATARYGMRGANGVILVTTKRGKAGKPSVKVGVDYSVMQASEVPEMVGAQQYATLVNQAHANDGLAPRYSVDQIAAQGSDPYLYPDVNWSEYMLRPTSNLANAFVQLTGGTDRIRYYTLVDYSFYDGMFKNTDLSDDYNVQNKYGSINFRTNVMMDISRNTSLDVRIGARLLDETTPESGSQDYYKSLLSTPSNRYVIFNEDGSYGGSNKYRSNPLGQLVNKGYDELHSRFFNMNVNLRHEFDYWVKGLSINGALSFVSKFNTRERYRGASFVSKELVTDAYGVPVPNLPDSMRYIVYGKEKQLKYDSRAVSQDRTQNFRASIDYENEFGDHFIAASLMADLGDRVYSNDLEAYRYANFSALVNYGYADRYFVDLVASYEGSNTYAPGNRFGFFPAAGFSWITSREDFLKDNQMLNFLKFRVSYGLSGLDAVGDFRRFMYLDNYAGSGGSHKFGETANLSSDGLKEAALANPDARWETGYKFNLGVDMQLFNSLSLTADFYNEIRADIIQSNASLYGDIPGIVYSYYNQGKVSNVGFDATLAYEKTYANDFGFNVGLNLGFSKNKILDFYEPLNAINSRIGTSLGSIYGYQADGFYQNVADIANSPVSSFSQVQPGDVKLMNQNTDNVINAYDKVLLGRDFPLFHLGLNLGMNYKGFYLLANFDAQTNYQVMPDNIVTNPLGSGYNNISVYAANNSWTPETASTATLPRLSTFENFNNNQTNTTQIKSGSFLRLNTAEIGYKLTPKQLCKVKMTGFKVFARAHNLFTLDHLEDLNVETMGNYPLMRQYNVGINVEF